MKVYLIVLLVLSVGCAGKKTMRDIQERIETADQKTLAEVKEDVKVLVNSHPELKDGQKKRIRKAIITAFKELQAKKEEEGKLLNELLHATLTTSTSESVRAGFLKTTKDFYESKGKIMTDLIFKLESILKGQPGLESLEHDMQIIFREIR